MSVRRPFPPRSTLFLQTRALVRGTRALFFCFAIVYYARKLHRDKEESFKLQIEHADLLALTAVLNQKLERENRELAHRVAVRGMSVESARERAERLEALVERSPLPQVECDASGNVLMCNPAAERVFGIRYEQMAGRPLSTFLAIPAAELDALLTEPHAETMEAEAHGRGGHRVPCTASFTPFPAIAGRRPGFGVVLTGIPVAVA